MPKDAVACKLSGWHESKNARLLAEFITYCYEHPEERFWQALRNWSGYRFVQVWNGLGEEPTDTFYWEGKNS